MCLTGSLWPLPSQELAHLAHVNAVQVATQDGLHHISQLLVESLRLGVPVGLQTELVTSFATADLLNPRHEGLSYALSTTVSGRDDLTYLSQARFDLERSGAHDPAIVAGRQRVASHVPHPGIIAAEHALIDGPPLPPEEVLYLLSIYFADFQWPLFLAHSSEPNC